MYRTLLFVIFCILALAEAQNNGLFSSIISNAGNFISNINKQRPNLPIFRPLRPSSPSRPSRPIRPSSRPKTNENSSHQSYAITNNCVKSCPVCNTLTSDCVCRLDRICFQSGRIYQPPSRPSHSYQGPRNQPVFYQGIPAPDHNMCLYSINDKKQCGDGYFCFRRKCCQLLRSFRGYKYQCPA